jgi:hypothetical protein
MGGGVVQDNMGTSRGRRATATRDSLLAAGLFIDSQTLVGDGALLDFGLVEAQLLFPCPSRRRWSWTAAAGYGGYKNHRDRFLFSIF